MKRINKKLLLSFIIAVILLPIGLFILSILNNDFRDWLKFRVQYSDYLEWKENGGEMKSKYFEPLILDRHRDQIVQGLSYKEILDKMPFLKDGNTYSSESYKGEYLKDIQYKKPNVKVLWFTKEDGFDWCIEIYNGKNKLKLTKG